VRLPPQLNDIKTCWADTLGQVPLRLHASKLAVDTHQEWTGQSAALQAIGRPVVIVLGVVHRKLGEENAMRKTFGPILLVAAAAVVIGGGPKPQDLDYQKLADEAKWTWDDEKASTAYCIKKCPARYRVDFISKPDAQIATIRFVEDDKLVYSWEGTSATVFVVQGNVLYYADFSPITTGCHLVARDLQEKKQLWKVRLKGVKVYGHSRYSNAVTLDLEGDALCVHGKESVGNYIEYVSCKSGKTLGNRVFFDR
jgi:hypothetical protein